MALVVVLSVVVILSLIVVSLAVAMRMERQAAFYFSERARADFMAREGVEMAKVLLSDTLGDTNNYVVSMPGRLMVISNGANGSWRTVDLASGPAVTPGTGALGAPDLNRTNRTGDGLRQIDPLGGPMGMAWIYVYQNGDRSTNASPAIDPNNPIIGRYAFWVDDESTRVNVNTAWKPSDSAGVPVNTNSLSHPSQVALKSLSSDMTLSQADGVYSATRIRPLQSVGEISRIDESLRGSLSTNRFSATPYNFSSELNPWGEPKIVLTTKSNVANGLPFLDILANQNVDPGGKPTSVISFPKLTVVMTNLIDLLSRSNWPYHPGKSYAQKFKPADNSRIAQLALDIIEYVRAAESTNEAVAMIRTRKSGSGFVNGGVAHGDFLGTSRHPLLTEIALWISSSTNAQGYYTGQVRAELYLPPYYGISSFPIANNHTVGVQLSGSTVLSGHVITAGEVTGEASGGVLSPGGYAIITTPTFPLKEALPDENGNYPAVSTNNPRVRVYFSQTGGGDIWEQGNGTGSPIPITLAPEPRPLVTDPAVTSVEVDDPRINKRLADWKMRASGNSFGQANSIWKTAASLAAGLPPQDRDGTSYSDHSLTMPPPKGQPGNVSGQVNSVAELGRISTGVESTTNADAPVQWRTVRFQPTFTADSSLPDWALTDLFVVPVPSASGTEGILFPATNAVAGRVNVNSQVQPFATNSKRTGLFSALQGASGLNISNAVQSIVDHTLAGGGRSFGTTNFYKSPGELVEIQGITDAGEISETNLHTIIGLMNSRSGVYRVFTVGQSLQQAPGGKLIINGTKYVETVLEPTDGKGSVLRSVSWRENSL